MQKINRTAWSKEETDLLYSLAGRGTAKFITNCFNQKTPGVKRTIYSIKRKLARCGLSTVTTDHSFSLRQLSIILNCAPASIQRWCRAPRNLKTIKRGNRKYVSRPKLIQWMLHNEDLFYGQDVTSLLFLMGDTYRSTIDRWASTPRKCKPIPVYCLQTNKTYPSLLAASKDKHIHLVYSTLNLAHSKRTSKSFNVQGYDFVVME